LSKLGKVYVKDVSRLSHIVGLGFYFPPITNDIYVIQYMWLQWSSIISCNGWAQYDHDHALESDQHKNKLECRIRIVNNW